MAINLEKNISPHYRSLTEKNEEIIKALSSFPDKKAVQSELIKVYLKSNGFDLFAIKNTLLHDVLSYSNRQVHDYLMRLDRNWTLKDLEFIFYSFFDKTTTNSNGIIFTPTEVSDYIHHELFKNLTSPYDITICDLSCGGGEFLISALKQLKLKFPDISSIYIVENILYGIDLLSENVESTKILLSLQILKDGEDQEVIDFNIVHGDSTLPGCLELFNQKKALNGFDFIVGNPPYVKIQHLNMQQRKILREHYQTCSSGNFNLFYAFIEMSFRYLKEDGKIGYIIPNHLLKMKSAKSLRDFLLKNKYIHKVIDFKDNQLFENAQTYSAIMFFDQQLKAEIIYQTVDTRIENERLASYLTDQSLQTIPYTDVNSDSINLLSPTDILNIRKIESQKHALKIMTGIATQKDTLYLIHTTKELNRNEDDHYYYTEFNGQAYKIEKEMTIAIIKGSGEKKIDESSNFYEFNRIIYPYKVEGEKVFTIPESEMATSFPETYAYFQAIKEELGKRNNGKPTVKIWYEYGRSQALNSFAPKIIFPTNSAKPNFTYFPDHALFNNGYAIFGLKSNDHKIDLDVLTKVLNSSIMEYYIKQTSYMISGGYYCYQKKYISGFTIPEFSPEELNFLKETTAKDCIDAFLTNKYDLKL